uniref:RNA polymerase b-subunit n=1 Tax=Pedobesia claviformis TaxID=2364088 RepID=A0A386B0V5_9CHLO|nr:RNA polymerase b-subunit [Pedobesia claviformis]AYC65320.1 RNA polymerase b-subunit [Pedobesia claviformis]
MIFYNFLFFIIDLLSIQRNSFIQFLEFGLITEIENTKSIFWVNESTRVIFYARAYKILKPNDTIQNCLLTGKTYMSEIYIPVL